MDICTYVWFVFKLQSGQQFKQRHNSSHNRDASTAMSRKSCMSMPHSKDTNTNTDELLDERLSSPWLLGSSKRNVSRLHRLTRCIWSDRSHFIIFICLVCDQQKWGKKASAQGSEVQPEVKGSRSEKTETPTRFHQFPTTFGYHHTLKTDRSGHTHTRYYGTRMKVPVRYERLVLGACPHPGTSKSVTIRDFYADDFIQTTDQIF